MRADKNKVEPLLKTARGQVDAILKMIEDDRYCIDIINQLLAAEALIKKARKIVLKGHLEGCVLDAISFSYTQDRTEKLDEIIKLLDKMDK